MSDLPDDDDLQEFEIVACYTCEGYMRVKLYAKSEEEAIRLAKEDLFGEEELDWDDNGQIEWDYDTTSFEKMVAV